MKYMKEFIQEFKVDIIISLLMVFLIFTTVWFLKYPGA